MKKNNYKAAVLAISLIVMSIFFVKRGWCQNIVFTDNFSTNTNTAYTTSGAIGASAWSVTRSGDDWGARRNTSPAQLELINDVGASANANGWVFASASTSSFTSPYNATLSSNTGTIAWTFNMKQITADPTGFIAGNYGVAFVLGSTSTSVATTGNGYAVVFGQTGSPDPIRLVNFTNGLQGTLVNLITSNTVLSFNYDYSSIEVTYTPSTNTWELFIRDDGISAFSDPTIPVSIYGALISKGTAIDNTYTGVPLTSMGGYWQGGTTANQTAFFDNVTVFAGLYFRSKISGNWNNTTTWQSSSDNSTWTDATSTPNIISGTISILNTHTVTVSQDVIADEIVVQSGGTIAVSTGKKFEINNSTGTDLDINSGGNVSVAGILQLDQGATINSTASTLTINNGGKYDHNYTTTAGTIPTATWSSGSTCEIIGYTTNTGTPGGLGQSFHHFTYNCANQDFNSIVNFAGGLTTVNGDFTFVTSNHSSLVLTDNTMLVMNIGGAFNVQGGSLFICNGVNTINFNITAGSYNQTTTGASMRYWANGANPPTVINMKLNVGDFSQTGGNFSFGAITPIRAHQCREN